MTGGGVVATVAPTRAPQGSYAERALVLLRVDGGVGELVTVADLAAHLALPEAAVRMHIVLLGEAGMVLPVQDGAGLTLGAMLLANRG